MRTASLECAQVVFTPAGLHGLQEKTQHPLLECGPYRCLDLENEIHLWLPDVDVMAL